MSTDLTDVSHRSNREMELSSQFTEVAKLANISCNPVPRYTCCAEHCKDFAVAHISESSASYQLESGLDVNLHPAYDPAHPLK